MGFNAWDMANHVGWPVSLMLLLGVLLFIARLVRQADAKLMAAIGLLDRCGQPRRLHAWVRAGRRRDRRDLHFGTLGAAAALVSGRRPGRSGCTGTTPAFPTAWLLAAGALLVYPQTVWFVSLVR